MEEFIKYVLSKIVSNPDQVQIEREESNGEIYFFIILPEEDRGVVIGKEGKNIKSIRNLISILAKKENKRVYIKIRD
jgi:predicted RNA-binding protein YlqC (UPF0109 family)